MSVFKGEFMRKADGVKLYIICYSPRRAAGARLFTASGGCWDMN